MGHKYNKTSSTSPRRTSLCRSRQHKRPIRPRERCLLKTIKYRHSHHMTMGKEEKSELTFNQKFDVVSSAIILVGTAVIVGYYLLKCLIDFLF